MTTIHLTHPLDGADYALVIEREGVEYIAAVMRREFERTADGGALHIAQEIERALSRRKDES